MKELEKHQERQRKLIKKWFFETFKPEKQLMVSDWADKYRMLSSKAASEAGPWRTERTPYLKEIMNVLSTDDPTKKIVFMKGSQVGGTEAGANWIGYIIDHSPGPLMIVWPRTEDARRNSKLRIEPLIEETPRIKQKVAKAKSRDSSNTILQKAFDGGALVMTGANSVAGLKSMPARFLFLDEVDEYPWDIEGQGDPISLVLARSRTFSRRKAFLVSTPTLKGASKIDSEFSLSDKRYYNVPCPDCGHYQKLEFKNLYWEPGKPETVLYHCEECGVGIPESKKTKMLKQGKWVATDPTAQIIGFHLNSLYSPLGWYSWKEIVEDYETAKRELEEQKKTEKMRAFINTVLGEVYEEAGESPEWHLLYKRREDYKMEVVPEGALFLTGAADIQKDRIECEVIAWGRGKESWSIDYTVLEGNTSDSEVWKKLEEYVLRTYSYMGNKNLELPVKLFAVDAGYETQQVYTFCRKFPATRVVPVKGFENLQTGIAPPRIVDVRLNGKTIRRGIKYWPVGTNLLKEEVYRLLQLEEPKGQDETYPEGFCHFPQYAEEYFKQLTAEKVITKTDKKGFSKTEWVKQRERNEVLDIRVYNIAAAQIIGIDRFRETDWQRLENNLAIAKPIEKVENKQKRSKPAKKRVAKRRKSSYW